MIQQTIKIYNK